MRRCPLLGFAQRVAQRRPACCSPRVLFGSRQRVAQRPRGGELLEQGVAARSRAAIGGGTARGGRVPERQQDAEIRRSQRAVQTRPRRAVHRNAAEGARADPDPPLGGCGQHRQVAQRSPGFELEISAPGGCQRVRGGSAQSDLGAEARAPEIAR